MAERKVLNKYYSPDFDPSLVKKRKSLGGKVFISRMMLPMTLRCLTCGSYSMIGTKFNMKTLRAPELKYLTIPIWRFHFKCQTCYSWITFRTDPKNTDYVCESGAVRNYEADKDFKAAEDTIKAMREEEEFGDAMKGLENKTGDSKREMEILEAIDEIEEINKRQVAISPDQIVKKIQENGKEEERSLQQEEEDEQDFIEKYYQQKKKLILKRKDLKNQVDEQGFQIPKGKAQENKNNNSNNNGQQQQPQQKKVKLNLRVKPNNNSNKEVVEKKVKLNQEQQKPTESKQQQEQQTKNSMQQLFDYSDSD